MEEKSIDDKKEDERDRPKQVVGEIRTITRGQVARGSYRSLRKAIQRQVNSVHIKHLIAKHHRSGDEDIIFFVQDARGVRQSHDDPLIIMLTIEGYNTRR